MRWHSPHAPQFFELKELDNERLDSRERRWVRVAILRSRSNVLHEVNERHWLAEATHGRENLFLRY
jgi:hypothetical protein